MKCFDATGLQFQSLQTSVECRVKTLNQLTLSPEDFPVRMYRPVDSGEASETEQDQASTLKWSESFANYDPDTCSWRTSQACLPLSNQDNPPLWQEFLETWPSSGLMLSGSVYQRPPLVPLTSGIGSSYLPTPNASLGAFDKSPHIDIPTWLRAEGSGRRKSGAKIGTSLRWSREFMREHLRTGGELNPEWIEVVMGFPIGHSELRPSETP